MGKEPETRIKEIEKLREFLKLGLRKEDFAVFLKKNVKKG